MWQFLPLLLFAAILILSIKCNRLRRANLALERETAASLVNGTSKAEIGALMATGIKLAASSQRLQLLSKKLMEKNRELQVEVLQLRAQQLPERNRVLN